MVRSFAEIGDRGKIDALVSVEAADEVVVNVILVRIRAHAGTVLYAVLPCSGVLISHVPVFAHATDVLAAHFVSEA